MAGLPDLERRRARRLRPRISGNGFRMDARERLAYPAGGALIRTPGGSGGVTIGREMRRL
jgi:hypothetical protein